MIFKYFKTRNAMFGALIFFSLVLSQPAFAQGVVSGPSLSELQSRQDIAESAAYRSCAIGSRQACLRAVRALVSATIRLHPDATPAALQNLVLIKLERAIRYARVSRPGGISSQNLAVIEFVLQEVDPDSTEPLTLSASPS